MEQVLIVFFGIYVLAISLEAIHDYKEQTGIYDWRDSLVNITMGLLGIMVRVAGKGLWLYIWYAIYAYSLFKIPVTIWSCVLLFFLNEFIYYWFHRLAMRNDSFGLYTLIITLLRNSIFPYQPASPF